MNILEVDADALDGDLEEPSIVDDQITLVDEFTYRALEAAQLLNPLNLHRGSS